MNIPVTEERIALGKEVDAKGFIENREGLKVVEKRDEKKDARQGIQCITWLLGAGARWKLLNSDLLTCEGTYEVYAPKKGDLAIYITHNPWGREQVHIGRMTSENWVISKWGAGSIYEHHIGMVPDSYGSEVRFFRGKEINSSQGSSLPVQTLLSI